MAAAVSNFAKQQAFFAAALNQFRKSGKPIATGTHAGIRYYFQRSTRFACRFTSSKNILFVTIPKRSF